MTRIHLSTFISTAVVIFILFGCSTKKNRFLNREYHTMTTSYNILYNGELAFNRGLSEINERYTENYWKLLPIEPIEIKEIEEELLEIPVYNKKVEEEKTDKKQSPFEIAEAKAVKAIQLHSMNIGYERNRKIDDAFLLLGKARYYSSRFVQALEAFTYVIKNYPEANLIGEATVWRAKTNIRLGNEDFAVTSLNSLLEKQKNKSKILEDIHITLAMAYQQLDTVSLVIEHLKEAIKHSKNSTKKSRNIFILGQLYRQYGNKTLSNKFFQKLIDFKKASYEFRTHAKIEKVKNYDKGDDIEVMIEKLQKMIKNRDNRPYLDELYYQLAILEGIQKNDEGLVENYKKSIHTKNAKPFQKGLSFEGLANFYFDKKDYIKSGAYYDSVLQVSGKLKTKRIRRLKKINANLEVILTLENIIKKNDSLSNIISMDKENQIFYFESYIKSLKEKEAIAKKESELQKKLEKYKNLTKSGIGTNIQNKKVGKKWYFYNIQALNFGEQEFKNVWGTRALEDNWRLSDKSYQQKNETIADTKIKSDNKEKIIPEKYKVSYYLKQIPKKISEIDSISELRSSAYYKLGLIYKEQFKEYKIAIEKLEKLLTLFPRNKFNLGANYHLYKIYKELKDPKSEFYKKEIVEKFPESIFAQIISNENDLYDVKKNKEISENRYEDIYLFYETAVCDETIQEISEALRIFEGTKIVPKLELLKAHAIAKTKGKEEFKKALDYVATNYANAEEGKKAKELLKNIK